MRICGFGRTGTTAAGPKTKEDQNKTDECRYAADKRDQWQKTAPGVVWIEADEHHATRAQAAKRGDQNTRHYQSLAGAFAA
jgi:hypothetical protein